nr:hypothetical protein GCM10025732_40230 [Glycomyces mayteni]
MTPGTDHSVTEARSPVGSTRVTVPLCWHATSSVPSAVRTASLGQAPPTGTERTSALAAGSTTASWSGPRTVM